MLAQVIDQAAGVTARQGCLASFPVAPVTQQGRLLLLLGSTVELVGSRQGQPQRFPTPPHQQPGNQLAPLRDRAKTLIVEVIGHPLRRTSSRASRA